MNRRQVLQWIGLTCTGLLAGCNGDQSPNQDQTTVPQPTDTLASPQPTVASPTGTPSPSPRPDQSPTSPTATPADASPTPTPTPTPPSDDDSTPTPSPTPTQTPTPTPTPTTSIDQVVEVGRDGRLRFDPDSFEIAVGDTVQWVWRSGGHNIKPASTPDDADWSGTPGSDTYGSGYEYTYTFDVAGEYDYYCVPHRTSGMTASFTVA